MRDVTRVCSSTVLALGLSAGGALAQTSLTMGMVLEPPHLDPTAGAAAAIREVGYANIFEGLTRIDDSGAVQPALARSWRISEDGRVYTFELVPNAVFHNGVPLTAEHVVFSFERAMAEDSVNAQKQLFEPIERVEAAGEHTVTITLTRPTGHFLFNLGWGDMVIVEPSSAAANRTEPVGTGPFRFTRWVTGDRVEIERNPDYWGEPAALERAVFKFIPDPAAATTAMLAGDIDAFANFPAPEALGQFENDPRFEVVIGSTEGETILALNHRRAPLGDLRIRQAMAHAIDKQAVVDGAMFGYGTPIGSHFAPHHPAYVDLADRYPYDPVAAQALLNEAGLEGMTLTLKLPPPSYARRSGEIIQAQLAAIGIDVEIIPMEWAQWLEQVFTGHDFDLTIVSHTEPMDIDIYARPDYYFGYWSPAFVGVMEELAASNDDAQRTELLGEAQAILAEDSVNVFLFQLAKHGVWKAGIEGLWHNSPIPANDLTRVRWAD